MSVYTRVEREELEAFLGDYPLGQLVDFEGISAGIENTNYFVTTTHGEYVLTLFEELSAEELPGTPLLHRALANGTLAFDKPGLDAIRRYSARAIQTLEPEMLLGNKPAVPVEPSAALIELRARSRERLTGKSSS